MTRTTYADAVSAPDELPLLNRSTQSLKILREQRAQHGAKFWVYLGAAAAIALVDLLPPLVYRMFTEQATALQTLDSVSVTAFLREFLLFGVLVATLLFAANFVWDLFQEWIYLQTEASLRRQVMRKLHASPLEVLDESQRGDWLTRISTDLRGVEEFVATAIPGQLRGLLVLAGISATFLWHGGWIAAALLATAAVLVAANAYAQKRLKPVLEEMRTIHGDILQALLESYEGLPTIRSLGAEPVVAREFETKVTSIIARGFRLTIVTSLVGGANGFVTSVLAALCLTYVGWRLAGGAMTVSDVLLYPFYIGMFYASALAVVDMLAAWTRFFIEGGRLGEFLYDSSDRTPQIPSLPGSSIGSVTLGGITVGFTGAPKLTRPFDLLLQRGQTLVIAGPSGCGKSTLLEMLAGLRTTASGHATARGSAGLPLGTWEAPMRLPLAWSALVEQRPYLFEGTLRLNLAPIGEPDDERLWAALAEVNLSDFAESVGGLGYQLRDMGKNLSEGQKYRLVLARALLLDRDFLLLDEPFASLDPFSVTTVCRALNRQRAAGRGIVIVSHMLPPELGADRIFDLQDVAVGSAYPHRGAAEAMPGPSGSQASWC